MSRSPLPPQFLAPRLYTHTCVPERQRHRKLGCPVQVRNFHLSRCALADNHYDTLGVSPSATQADIKKKFYELSKIHHPDHNPDNAEEASQKFVAVSEAYTVLGNPTKREKYDRDVMRAQAAGSPSGSYSSSSPGGRKATGLSKRKANFRGPPPSFYRSGGWGSQSSKRSENAGADGRATYEETEARRQERVHKQYSANNSTSGAESDPWPFRGAPNDVPHFNRNQHYRTQTTVEEQLRRRRMSRRVGRDGRFENFDDGAAGAIKQFFMVSGVVVLAMSTSLVFFTRGPTLGV